MKTKAAFILLLVFLLFTGTTYSQSHLQIGHVDIMKILSQLPERDSAQVILDKETREIQTEFEEMQVIYNRLVDDYTKGQSTYSELVKKAKEDEILDKQKRLQEFEQNATATLQRRNGELLQPIYEKIIKAIETVATRNSFTYILDVSKGSVAFTSKDSQNIDHLVLDLLK
jgi:outer membrane protein